METDLKKIRELSELYIDDNWEFRNSLERYRVTSEMLDRIMKRLFDQVSQKIDCTSCGNCCKEVCAVLDREDIKIFSKGLGITAILCKEKYLVEDNDPGQFLFKRKPCPFQENRLCSNYDFRPKECESYPHFYKPGNIDRLVDIIGNCFVCPLVFNVFEALKHEVWHRVIDDDFDDLD